jgi:hypothetical protein
MTFIKGRTRKMWVVILMILSASLVTTRDAFATYNANTTGVVIQVLFYAETDNILLRLGNQPTSHPSCNPAYFVLSYEIPEARRKAMVAMLLAARISGEPINIGYDNTGSCANGMIRVYEIG